VTYNGERSWNFGLKILISVHSRALLGAKLLMHCITSTKTKSTKVRHDGHGFGGHGPLPPKSATGYNAFGPDNDWPVR